MANRLGASGGHTLLACIGVYAFAWCVGFLVIIAPAGAGVRDPILLATLTPMVGFGAATAIMLVSRLITIIGDLVGAAVAGAFSARATANAPDASEAVDASAP
jgi:hypothetical protein